jgi:putative salt-induced outer membrane protein YdiY
MRLGGYTRRPMNLLFRTVLAAALLPAIALADPAFTFNKPEDVKAVVWNAQAKAGLLLSGGNSQSVSLSAGGTASRKSDNNRFLLEAGIAYARSQLRIASDVDGNGSIGPSEIQTSTQTTTQAWNIGGRYDRFFGGDQNSAFLSARIASDKPAGKELLGGGQIGYSRQIFKSDRFETLGELGYDFTSEKDVDLDAVAIHSLRGYLQQSVRLSETANFVLKVEALENLNSENAPYEPDGNSTVPSFADLRVNGSAALNLAINTRFSVALGFTVRYDNAPALRPPFAVPYEAGFQPFADKLDTLTEAALVVTLL